MKNNKWTVIGVVCGIISAVCGIFGSISERKRQDSIIQQKVEKEVAKAAWNHMKRG